MNLNIEIDMIFNEINISLSGEGEYSSVLALKNVVNLI